VARAWAGAVGRATRPNWKTIEAEPISAPPAQAKFAGAGPHGGRWIGFGGSLGLWKYVQAHNEASWRGDGNFRQFPSWSPATTNTSSGRPQGPESAPLPSFHSERGYAAPPGALFHHPKPSTFVMLAIGLARRTRLDWLVQAVSLFRVRGLDAAPVRKRSLDALLADRLVDLDPIAFGKAFQLLLRAHHGRVIAGDLE
jgi:hypothetical protein